MSYFSNLFLQISVPLFSLAYTYEVTEELEVSHLDCSERTCDLMATSEVLLILYQSLNTTETGAESNTLARRVMNAYMMCIDAYTLRCVCDGYVSSKHEGVVKILCEFKATSPTEVCK